MGRPALPASLLYASTAIGVPGVVVIAAWATGSLGTLGLYAPPAAYETAMAAHVPAAAAPVAARRQDTTSSTTSGSAPEPPSVSGLPSAAEPPVTEGSAAARADATAHGEHALGRTPSTARPASTARTSSTARTPTTARPASTAERSAARPGPRTSVHPVHTLTRSSWQPIRHTRVGPAAERVVRPAPHTPAPVPSPDASGTVDAPGSATSASSAPEDDGLLPVITAPSARLSVLSFA